jgi:hypothetical protein
MGGGMSSGLWLLEFMAGKFTWSLAGMMLNIQVSGQDCQLVRKGLC